MGLGSLDAGVGLAEARAARDEARRVLRSGHSPIESRREARRAAAKKATFGDVADELLQAKAKEWRNEKHREQWRWSLTEAAAELRPRPVDEIDTEGVLAVLKPLWTTKPETASRLRGRIEAVLDAATAQGLRSGENPGRWRGHLSHLLPKRQKLTRGHHAAMEYADVPALMATLQSDSTIAAKALEFCILTATRTGEVLGARWSEIGPGPRVWIIPAARTKAAREHRVPLSDQSQAILKEVSSLRTSAFIFPSPRGDRPLSHIAMAKVLSRLGIKGATVHGFRSAFRDWAGNETQFAREVAEAALAHVVGDKAEQAYRRSDALEKRRALMQAWGNYCEPPKADSNVTPLPARTAESPMDSENFERLFPQAREEIREFAPGWNERHLLLRMYDIRRFAFFNGERAIPLARRRGIERLAGDLLLEPEGGPPGFWNELGDLSGREPDWRNVSPDLRATKLLKELDGLGGLSAEFLDGLRARAASERQRFAASHTRGGDRRSGEHSVKSSVLRMAVRLYCEADAKPGGREGGPLFRFANVIGEFALGERAPFKPGAVRAEFRRMKPKVKPKVKRPLDFYRAP
jgi:integrase